MDQFMKSIKIGDYVVLIAYNSVIGIYPVTDIDRNGRMLKALDWNIDSDDLREVGKIEFRRISTQAHSTELRNYLTYIDSHARGSIWELRCEVVKP
jgi:hypothetical protein